MKKIIDRIVLGSGSPNQNDLWVDDRDGLSLKVYDDGEWKSVGAPKSSEVRFLLNHFLPVVKYSDS